MLSTIIALGKNNFYKHGVSLIRRKACVVHWHYVRECPIILFNINLVFLMLIIRNTRSWGQCAPGCFFRVTRWQLVVLYVTLQRSMAAIIEASMYRCSQVAMAASIYVCSGLVTSLLQRHCPLVLPSSCCAWNIRDRKRKFGW